MLHYSWSEDFSVGDLVLDDHHRNLLNLFNDSYQLIVSDAPSEQIIKLISELKVYAIFHFAEEEKKMKAAGYDGLDIQIVEHQKFIENISRFEADLSKSSKATAEEIFLFLNNWLIKHIQKEDMKFKGRL